MIVECLLASKLDATPWQLLTCLQHRAPTEGGAAAPEAREVILCLSAAPGPSRFQASNSSSEVAQCELRWSCAQSVCSSPSPIDLLASQVDRHDPLPMRRERGCPRGSAHRWWSRPSVKSQMPPRAERCGIGARLAEAAPRLDLPPLSAVRWGAGRARKRPRRFRRGDERPPGGVHGRVRRARRVQPPRAPTSPRRVDDLPGGERATGWPTHWPMDAGGVAGHVRPLEDEGLRKAWAARGWRCGLAKRSRSAQHSANARASARRDLVCVGATKNATHNPR